MLFVIGLLIGLMAGFYIGWRKGQSSDGFSPEEKEMVRQILSVLTYGGKRED